MSTSKKLKTEKEEFELLRAFLRECSTVSISSAAMQGALRGIDEAEKRLERDWKLQQKFSAVAKAEVGVEEDDDVVHVSKSQTPSPRKSPLNEDELNEWHDVGDKEQALDEGSLLGRRLAASAIKRMSSEGVEVSNHISALALALHAALVSEALEFACTGVPEEQKAPSGFAAPVRALPKEVFLPSGWDKSPSDVRLRYRKNGLGATILSVSESDESVEIKLTPTATEEPPTTTLLVQKAEFINLESLSAAVTKGQRAAPALHYKSLPLLMTRFCGTFDLGGTVQEDGANPLPYVDATTVVPPGSTGTFQSTPVYVDKSAPPLASTRVHRFPPRYNEQVRPTIDQFNVRPHRGDFAGDLGHPGLPAGMGSSGGNLMGPGHPAFGMGPDAIGLGPAGMRPRFDPYGPPMPDDVLPGAPSRGRGLKRPGGEPNPDHLKPPNNLGNNMFM